MKVTAFPHSAIQWMARLSLRGKIRLIWFSCVFLFFCWMTLSYQVKGLPEDVLTSNTRVIVLEADDFISFSPVEDNSNLAYLFYPGALVAPKAYAPYARAIAQHGYKTFIVKMPFRMASLHPHKALQLIQANSQVQRWVIGGHSLGGSKAAQFAFAHSSLLEGLILLGTSHPRETDMSALALDVTKIYGTHDGLASMEEVLQFKKNLPPHTNFVEIPGGNHAQFGWYGAQLGDRAAAISRETQQALVVKATLTALQRISKNP